MGYFDELNRLNEVDQERENIDRIADEKTEELLSSYKYQKWHCEKCGSVGLVEYPGNSDKWTVVEAIRASHGTINPGCDEDVSNIIMLNKED